MVTCGSLTIWAHLYNLWVTEATLATRDTLSSPWPLLGFPRLLWSNYWRLLWTLYINLWPIWAPHGNLELCLATLGQPGLSWAYHGTLGSPRPYCAHHSHTVLRMSCPGLTRDALIFHGHLGLSMTLWAHLYNLWVTEATLAHQGYIGLSMTTLGSQSPRTTTTLGSQSPRLLWSHY